MSNNVKKHIDLSKCERISETVVLGTLKGKALEWEALRRDGDRVLLVSKHIIDDDACFTNDSSIIDKKGAWYHSVIKNVWVKRFYNKAFTKEEKRAIQEVSINNWYNNSKKAIDTTEKIFILSVDEINELFELPCYKYSLFDESYSPAIWTRTPAKMYDEIQVFSGKDFFSAYSDGFEGFGIVPAMWIDVNILNSNK